MIGFSSSGLCDKKEVKFDRTDIFGGEGFVQVLFLLLSLFGLVFFMFFVLVFALLVKLNFYCYYFLYVRRLYFLYLLSLRQEFGKRILRGTAFLSETVCFDCK